MNELVDPGKGLEYLDTDNMCGMVHYEAGKQEQLCFVQQLDFVHCFVHS